MDKQLQLFGLMNKAGRLAIGDEPVTDAVEVRQARVLVLAADAGDNTARRFQRLAQTENVICLTLPYSKEELGGMLGNRVCAVAAVCDIGFAAKLLQLSTEAHPELAEAAEKMQAKADHLWAEQKKKRREQEQAKKYGNRPQKAAPVQQQSGKSAPERTQKSSDGSTSKKSSDFGRKTTQRDTKSGYKPKKVYGKPSGGSYTKPSLGDRRREDAERKLNHASGDRPQSTGKKTYGSRTGNSAYHKKTDRGASGRANGGNAK